MATHNMGYMDYMDLFQLEILGPIDTIFVDCMFKINCKGEPAMLPIPGPNHMKCFISCESDECISKRDECYKIWMEKVAFGSANYLRDQFIKVRRSNGDIDEDWKLFDPFVRHYFNKDDWILCRNSSGQEKCLKVVEIIELNPPAEPGAPVSIGAAVAAASDDVKPNITG